MPAKKHDFTMTEIKAGLLVVAAAVTLALFVAALRGLRPPEPRKEFHTLFKDTGGLSEAADVRFGGLKVGRVLDIRPSEERRSWIQVSYHVREDVPVNEDSNASITQTTLTSEKHLEITTGTDDAPLLAAGAEVPGQTGGLFAEVGTVAQGVAEVLRDVRALLGVEEVTTEVGSEGELVTIAQIFGRVGTAVEESGELIGEVHGAVRDSRGSVAEVLVKVQQIEDSAHGLVEHIDTIVRENRPDVRRMVQSGERAVSEAEALVSNANKAADRLEGITVLLESVLTNAESTSGDVKLFVDHNRPMIDDIVYDLRETIRHLKTFARTVSDQPDAIIRGKAAQGRR